jgi:hypothetical protein
MRVGILLAVGIAAAQLTPASFAPREFSAVVAGTVAQAIEATPKAGWVFIVGTTIDPAYPTTTDAFDRTCGTDGACNPVQDRFGVRPNADVVFTLVDASGQIHYSTFLGGAGQDDTPRMAVAPDGIVWLMGATTSAAFDGAAGGCGGSRWLARFDMSRRAIIELRCLAWPALALDIALDARQRLWVLASAGIPGLATSTAYQRQFAGQVDLLLARFGAGDTAPQYATYLGGRGFETAGALAVAPNGAIAVTGATTSQDFPVVRAFKSVLRETSPVDGDAFVTVLDPAGQALQFSTYFGGARSDNGVGIAVDEAGMVAVIGTTRSSDVPVSSAAHDTRCGNDGACDGSFDGFAATFDAAGSLLASTYLGGSGLDTARAIRTAAGGRVVALVTTQSADYPLTEPSPSGRTPGVNREHTALTIFDSRLSAIVRSTVVADQQYLPNVGVLAVRQGFAFAAGQVTPFTGLASGSGTYLRAIRLP